VSPDAFRQMIHRIGRVPAQRNTLYDLLRIFPRPGWPPVEVPPREARRPSAICAGGGGTGLNADRDPVPRTSP
jgi:hypothetical protein